MNSLKFTVIVVNTIFTNFIFFEFCKTKYVISSDDFSRFIYFSTFGSPYVPTVKDGFV